MIKSVGILAAVGILFAVACAVPFTPAECASGVIVPTGINDFRYRDFLRGDYQDGECHEIIGEILQPVGDDGYRISTEGYGTSYNHPDVFLYWQGDAKFVEGDPR